MAVADLDELDATPTSKPLDEKSREVLTKPLVIDIHERTPNPSRH